MSHAATDPECLKHLGGAFSGVECFNGLSNDLRQENKILAKKVDATIPPGNKNRELLNAYKRDQIASRKYCELTRESLTDWKPEQHLTNPRYHDSDVVYYECVYDLLKLENQFLKNLLKNITQE